MKQKLWITLVIVVLMTALCCGIAAAEIVDSGTFDGGGEWTFDDNGVLTISGTAHTSSRPLDSELREAITQVVLGPDVEEVASYTFSGAKKLALFVVDPANQNYTAVDGVLYSKDMTRLVRMPSAITGSFTIPASVTSLAADAFIASSLTEIIFPEGLTEIPDHCLYWCQSMTTVRLPSTLLFIGYAAFEDCDSLTNIYYSGTCSNWQNEVNISEINDYLLLNPIHCTDGDCPAQSVTGSCGTNVTFVLTPEGTLTVSGAGEWNGWAFESDPFIKRVILEPGVTEIGDGAFYWSTNISEITIPDTVTKIGYEAIYACHLLTSITIPASVTEIENEAFNGCNNLKEVHFGGTMAAWNSMVSTDRDHYILTKRPIYCSDGIISVVQPASGTFDDGLAWDLDGTGKLTISGNGRFDDFLDYDIRQQITTVCFGAGITYIEPGRFSYSYDLIAFEVDADNPYYTAVDGVLYTKNMTELVECPTAKSGSLVIPDTVTIICHDAFIGSYLSSITLSANLETIGYQAFWNSSLTEITLPAGYSGYDSSVFNGSDRLTAFYVASDNPEFTAVDGLLYSKDMSTLIRVPGGYSGSLVISGETTHHIGEGAFQRCKELTSVTLSEGIETIEPSAFSGSGIKTVNLPLSLATINDSAFKNADALTTVNYSGTTADWSNVSILGNNNSLLFCTIHCQDGDAEPKPVSTSIGDGITYTLTPEGVLTITGGGVWNDWAFDSNQSIVQAILEPGVTEIGWGGLAWCQSLQSISIPDSVTEIKYEAFYYCSSLEAITIPASVTVFGDRVFDGCDNLTEITFGGTTEEWAALTDNTNNAKLTQCTIHCSDGDFTPATSGSCGADGDNLTWAYADGTLTISGTGAMANYQTPWAGYSESITQLIVGSGVTTIGADAFSNLHNLSNVSIPDSVTSIGNQAFGWCFNLNQIELPGVTSIESFAFYMCSSLRNFNIPNSLTEIDDYTFADCSSLARVTIPASVTAISGTAFDNCPNLILIVEHDSAAESYCQDNLFRYAYSDAPDDVISWTVCGDYTYSDLGENTVAIVKYTGTASNLTVPAQLDGKTVVKIGRESFRSEGINHTLTTVTLPDTVTSIGANAFLQCIALRSIHLPDSLQSIGYGAFSETALQSIELPDGLQTIDDFAFSVTQIPNVTIPASVTRIGRYAFDAIEKLTNIVILDGEPPLRIDDYAFKDNAALTNVTIPARTISIGNEAFETCTSLKSLNLAHTTIDSIGVQTFLQCTSLEEITLPATLKTIGRSAFNGCQSLTDITLPSSVTTLEIAVFSDSGLTSITIPKGITAIPVACFSGCENLSSVVIPDSVTSIENYAFDSCNSLAHIVYFGTQAQWEAITVGTKNEALQNAAIHCVPMNNILDLPANLTTIESQAFIDLPNVDAIRIPASVISIATDAFDPDVILIVKSGSWAAEWVESNHDSYMTE